jgi:hypothetical protein
MTKEKKIITFLHQVQNVHEEKMKLMLLNKALIQVGLKS